MPSPSQRQKDRFIFTVSSRESGMRLLSFLREKCQGICSIKALKRAIDQKKCKINGVVEIFSSHVVQAKDRIELQLTEDIKTGKKKLEISLLYEDEQLLICNKPAGLVCSDPEFHKHLPSRLKKCLLIHRLDKETSGVLMLAKTEGFKKQMIALFTKKLVHKEYLAIVDGIMRQDQGKIESVLSIQHRYQGQSIWGSVKGKKGAYAVTEWKCLKRGKNASLLLCIPVTGKTHQIRVHLSEMGHPILGDHQYGKNFLCPWGAERHLLHALCLCFIHPILKKKLKITATPPEDFLFAEKSLFEINYTETT